MWEYFEPFARFLNLKILGVVSAGTIIAFMFLGIGGGLLFISDRQSIKVIIGGLLVGVGLGFFWITLGANSRK